VGSGSRYIAYELTKKNLNLELYLLDLNKKMLDQGKKRFKNENNINFIESDAEKLDFSDNFFDKYIISFCLRNITNYKRSIKEAYRVLKPGGKYCCLEFSSPRSSIISDFYKVYKSTILPLLGDVVANDRNAYKYLSESIDLFPTQDELKKILISYGFENVKFINLFNGIVAIHIGYKI
jgi:ubiquinone/menaquinone biosynthesis methyltransferases